MVNILLVEDDIKIGNWLSGKIKSQNRNINIFWAKNFIEGSKNLNSNVEVDIIILDLKLPDGNGVNLIKMVKNNKPNSVLYVFSVSVALKGTCLRLGADTFFDKTTESDLFLSAINKHIQEF